MKFARCAALLFGCATSLLAQAPVKGAAADALPPLTHFDAKLVDSAADPCVDFHQYACGKIIANTPIATDEAAAGNAIKLIHWNQAVLHQILMGAAAKKSGRTPNEQKIGDYWTACMDEAGTKANGLKMLKPELDAIKGLKSKAEIADIVAKLHTTIPGAWIVGDAKTASVLFGFGPTPDYNDVSNIIGGFDQAGISLPNRDFYLNDDEKSRAIRAKFLVYAARVLQLAGEPTVQAQKDANTVFAMQTALARAQMAIVARRDPANVNHRLSYSEVKALAPSFNFDSYLRDINAPTSPVYLVTTPDFFKEIENLIQSESLDHWQAYLRYYLLDESAAVLGPDFEKETFNFYAKTLFGVEQQPPLWRRCVVRTDRDLGEALGEVYVERAFPPQSKQRMLALVNDILSALGRDIDAVDWMQPATKAEAHKKLAAQIEKIGYPDHFRDYTALEITPDSLLVNVQRATEFESRRQMQKIGKPLDRQEWQMTPPAVDAYEDPQTNTINFPAGILQPPFFDATADDAANYGAIGAVIGHETIHGYDDQGRKFDDKGNLRDWWSAADAKNYSERGDCIANEYTQFVPEAGVKQDGRLTQGEDTADNGGLNLALSALQQSLKRESMTVNDKAPDGLTYSQRFYLSFANDWCAAFRPQAMRTLVLSDPHSLPKYRVNNVVSNMPEFAKAFGCKAGQPMVYAKACRVW